MVNTAHRLPSATVHSDDGVVLNRSDQPVDPAGPAAPEGGGGGQRTEGELFLGVAAVARRLGVAPATLRTWDRRYGIGPAEHAPGAHRRYGPTDVGRLEAMQHALLRGASPAEAARYALAAAPPADQAGTAGQQLPPGQAPPERTSTDRASTDRASTDPSSTGRPSVDRTPMVPLRAGEAPGPPLPRGADLPGVGPPVRPVRVGGRSLRLPGADARARGLARAAVSLDSGAVRLLLADSLAADGIIATWDRVVRPALGAIASCWRDTGAGVEIEHLLTEGVLGVFRDALVDLPPSGTLRPVLLACVPDELHSLPLYPLAAALGNRGVRCRILGAALPGEALLAAVRRTAPSAVFLWAQLERLATPDLLAGIPTLRPRVRVFAGGPGWAAATLPPSAERVDSLVRAINRIYATVGNGTKHRPPLGVGGSGAH